MDSLRIGIVISRYPPVVGGAELHTHELARRLAKEIELRVATLVDYQTRDWLGEVLTSGVKTGKRYTLDGVEIEIPRLDTFELATVKSLLQTYKSRPEIRHVLMKALVSIYRTKLERVLAGLDLVHCVHVGSPVLDLAAFDASRRLGIPFVYTPLVHVESGDWESEDFQVLYRRADMLVAMTEFEKRWLVARGAPESRIKVTGVGPVLSEKEALDVAAVTSQDGKGKRSVVFIGQKVPSKGIETLLQAAPSVWESLPDVEFVFLGPSTPYSERLFDRVCDHRIREVGEVDVAAKTRILGECSLLCSPSTQESFGGVLIEAWKMGKPVVAVDTEVSRELIDASGAGVYVPNTSEALAEALVFVLSDAGLAEALGEKGREFVDSRYTWEIVCSAYLEEYTRLTGKQIGGAEIAEVA